MRPDWYPAWDANHYTYEMHGEFADSEGLPKRVTVSIPIYAEALADLGTGFVRQECQRYMETFVQREFGHIHVVRPIRLFLRDDRAPGGCTLIPID